MAWVIAQSSFLGCVPGSDCNWVVDYESTNRPHSMNLTASLPQSTKGRRRMKRSYLMFLLCIAFAVPLRASPPLGAVVDSWHSILKRECSQFALRTSQRKI